MSYVECDSQSIAIAKEAEAHAARVAHFQSIGYATTIASGVAGVADGTIGLIGKDGLGNNRPDAQINWTYNSASLSSAGKWIFKNPTVFTPSYTGTGWQIVATPTTARLLQATDRCQVEGFTRQTFSFPDQFTRGDFRNDFRTGRYPASNLKWVFPNWGISSGESAPANDITIEAAYENSELNTVTRIAFASGDTQRVGPKENAVSSTLAVSLPANYEFLTRSCVTLDSASHWFFDGFGSGPDNGVFSTRATSQVMATGSLIKGAGEANLSFYSFGPVNIIGELPANAMSVALVGDSITMGASDTNGVFGQTGFSRRGCMTVEGGFVPSTNYGRSFEFLQALADTRGDLRAAHVTQYHTHCVLAIGTNDLGGSYNFATMTGWYLQAFAKLRQNGVKLAVCTIFPRTTGLNPQVYYNANYAPGGLRDQLNDWFYTQVGVTIDAVIDVSTPVEDPVNSSHWYIWNAADGTHPYETTSKMASVPVRAWLESELAIHEHTVAPEILSNPSLSGTPVAGGTVVIDFGKYRGIPTSKSVRVYINGSLVDTLTPAAGVTSMNYVIDAADLPIGNAPLYVEIDFTNPAGTTTATSNTLTVVGFYPTVDPNLVAFYNPNDLGGVSITGSVIDVLNNLDADGTPDATSSGSARPTYNANSFGSKYGALFDGSDDQFIVGGTLRTLIATGNFVFLAGIKTTNASKTQRIFGCSNGATMTAFLQVSSTSVRANFPGAGNTDYTRTQDTNPCVVGYQVFGRTSSTTGTLRVIFNGNKTDNPIPRTDPTVTHGPFIGRDYNVLNGFQGHMGPIIILSGDTSTADLNKHGRWLANEIGSTWVDIT